MNSFQLTDQLQRMSLNPLDTTYCMILGYYPLRGKAQMCRLLCEYFQLPYQDVLFTPKTWEQFKTNHKLDWTFQQLPFLKDGDMVITQTYPICLYIIEKAKKGKMLGNNLIQEIKIDTEIWKTQPASYLFTSFVNHRDYTKQVKLQATQNLWNKYLKQKLSNLQKDCSQTFFFPEISLLDFYIYQTFYFLKILCPQKISSFPKLAQVFARFSEIPEIKKYEKSKRKISEVCPIKFFINWRQRCSNKNYLS